MALPTAAIDQSLKAGAGGVRTRAVSWSWRRAFKAPRPHEVDEALAVAKVKDTTQAAETVTEAVRARGRKQLAELEIRRSIVRLDQEGVPQRVIANLVGLSQAEVSRRIKRAKLTPLEVTPRELILRRSVGDISTSKMMEGLRDLSVHSSVPSGAAVYDPSATAVGAAQQIMASFREGLLTDIEYRELQKQNGHPR